MDKKISQVKSYLMDLQDRICAMLEAEDGAARFRIDNWQSKLGTGSTRVITGDVIEKGGVNFSHVKADKLPAAATAHRPGLAGKPFEAMGVSLVIHPKNPFAPTSHMNARFLIVQTDGQPIWWFGGGFDLTPYYGFTEDCIHWHQEAKKACDSFGQAIYPDFKKQCDAYFYLKHRQEARGIGGLFYDDYNQVDFEHSFGLAKSIGDHYITAYQPILNKRKSMPYTQAHVEFQHIRRGRYVEFNLVYDRGTHFGLQSGGRTESILMSLPKHVSWVYDYHPVKGSAEENLYTDFLPVKDWLKLA